MTKTAFLFAGQGAQYLEWGVISMIVTYRQETIDQASQVLGYDLMTRSIRKKPLNQTRYAASYSSDFG